MKRFSKAAHAARFSIWVAAIVLASVFVAAPASAASALSVEIINGYNLIVDSNVTSPSTYAPSAAYIGARVCNTGTPNVDPALQNVIFNTGNYNGGVSSTPGVFPVYNSTGDATRPQVTNTGNYSLTLESDNTPVAIDAARFLGPLAAGECRVQYWLVSYPQCVNVGGVSNSDFPPCGTSITGSIQPTDDVSVPYDVWATATGATTVNARRSFTLRNEISASANKIWPNTSSKVPDQYLAAIQSVIGWGTLGPDGLPLSGSNTVYPGQRVITTQGIWYDLGNVGQGFDNDGDLIPDQNAWLQPVGDAGQFDADCFRMVNVYGLLIVKLKSGGELLLPFQNELYFEHIPDNTGVVGLAYYQFVATEAGCSAAMTPYQEAASGFDNEKFSADFGLSNPLTSKPFDVDLTFSKDDGVNPPVATGTTLTYSPSVTNTTGANLGAPDYGVPLIFRDSIPAGTTFVAASADDSPNTNLSEPTGTGSYTQNYIDNDGNSDLCTINYNITSSSYVIFYSNDNGSTWTTTEPGGVTDIQWLLYTTLALDGYHNGVSCVAPNGVYDNGTLQTSLPAGKTTTVRFQVTVNATGGPIVCNTAHMAFGGASAADAQICTQISGNNTLNGIVFRDDGSGTSRIYGNGIQDAGAGSGETGIGAGVTVRLYYDANGNGVVDSSDPLYGTTTTSNAASGTNFSFGSLPDGRFLVVVKKYDGAAADDATDATFSTTGWGNTTIDPNLSLTTDQGAVKMNEDASTVTLAFNIDLDHSSGAQTISGANFGFAPPFRVTKTVAGNPDSNADGRADTAIDEGDLFNYSILLENRLPSVGVQGPTGCQYTVWAPTGTNGSPANKEFTNPTAAWDGPNRNVASALVQGGGTKYIQGTGFTLATQAGNITKVEALYFGYFSAALTDDNLTLKVYRAGLNNSTTFNTALISSYVGEPADLNPNSAISWDVTSLRPGGGTWSWTDNFAAVTTEINPSKSANADEKTFYLDGMGLRITTDQPCEAGTSTTLSPVPLRDSYDTGSVDFVSASPAPTSVNTSTGIITWDDVGPILPGSTQVVTVTVRAKNITGTRTGSCGGSAPPSANSACNWAEGGFGTTHVLYADGRQANDGSSKIAISMQGKGEIHGALWRDSNNDGWPDNDGEPKLPNVTVTLFGCVASGGAMETGTPNKTCTGNGGTWNVIATDVTDSNGAYDFIGLDNGYYIVEVGDTDGAPATGNSSPFGGTQTAEANDNQLLATANGLCVGCNNTWGNPNTALNTANAWNLLNSPTAEEVINNINFGYNIPNAIIYGNIWWDYDGDATRDAFDGNLSGFTVQRYSDPNGDGNPADGTLQATTTTDTNGNYSFSGLAAASYVIVVTPPALLHTAWSETVESTGGTSSLNNQIPVTVTAGQISGSHDFGYTQAVTSDIGDYLYYDFDGDGIKDATESGIPNVTVWLYEDIDRDGTIDAGVDTLVSTQVSDSTGHYLFQNFAAGSYIVKVDTTDPDFPSDVLATGDPDLATGRIGDTIFLDSNGNAALNAGEDGIPLVVVNLYTDTDGSGTLNGADSLVASTVTNANGNYLFTGLVAGNYFVDVDESTLPSTSLAITTTDPANTLINLASGGSNLNADAGYSLSSNFSIGNRIWHDVDNDGVQDPGEPGIPFVDIVVTNGTGTGCPSGCRVTTDAAGFWIVTGLTNGTFTVDVDTSDADFPSGFTLTTGTDPRTATVAGADLTNVDFAYRYTGVGSTPTGTVSGRVFQDADGDLAYDVGEARSGTTVNLLDDQGRVVATTTTAADGTYSFTGVFIGQYNVQAVDTLGTRYSTIFVSTASTFANLNVIYQSTIETTADSQSSVAIDGVHSDLLQDFGYQRYFGSIGDTVYQDSNENGSQDLGEPGIANVTVRLYDAVWSDTNNDGYFQANEGTKTLVATTSTIADNPLTTANEGGTYLFSNISTLASGHNYLVIVDTTTLPGVSQTLIADPDTDGVPCTSLTGATDPPNTVCDSNKLVVGFLSGNNYLGADFGYRITGTNFATFGDHLWIDTDGDGVLDSGEAGIDAVTVWLDTDNDGVLDWTDGNGNNVWDSGEGEQWTSTDPDGYYVFANMADGTYNLKVLTSDPQWPSGLSTTPTFEVRSSNTGSLNNAVQVVVSGGVVTSIVDGYGANDPDTCTSCNLNVDFGYRYAGTNALSGTVCVDGTTLNGYCGSTATTYSGVDGAGGEVALESIQVTVYRWTDDGDNSAWDNTTGVLDSGDSFTLLGSTSTNSLGDYSFSNLPNNVVVVFSISETQQMDLTTTNANSSVEDANVIKRQLFEGTTTYLGNTVTVIGRQALSNLDGDTDDIIRDLDYAFDATLGGALTWDFGDLPSGYASTLLANSGAQHRVTGSSIRLGASVTTENNGTESATASADGGDNGITMVSTAFRRGGSAFVDITASAAGWLVAWMDFNGDGDFDDADEMIFDQPVNAGVNSQSFVVPSWVNPSMTDFFSRFRIFPSRPTIAASSGPGLDSNFQILDGEVEDYLFVMDASVTFAEMMSTSATQGKNHVVINWATNREVDNLGFDVYRSVAGGARERLNKAIITGSAFATGRNTTGPRGYRFVDRNPPSGLVQYWVEDIDLNGTRTPHGPITPQSSSTPSIDDVASTDPDATLGSVGGILTTEPGMGVTFPAPGAPGAQQLDEQWKLAAVQAVKVVVTKPGWYRVKKSELLAAGFDPGTNGNAISVFSEGVEIPVLVNAKNAAKFDNDDSIEFLGRAIDTPGTGGRVYYVTAKKGTGLRVKSVGGKGNSGTPAPPSFSYTFGRIERTLFFSALINNGERENFFGKVITPSPVTTGITVNNLAATGNAELEIVIQGGTKDIEHIVSAKMNGTHVGYIRLTDQERKVETISVPLSTLVPGENTLTLTSENGWVDISVVESLKFRYPHAYRADSDALTFTLEGGSRATVSGFTTSNIRVVDITDPSVPRFIDADIGSATDGSKSLSFSTTGSGTQTFLAFGENRVLSPAAIAYNEPSTWNAATNGANFVILTNRAFVNAANTLKNARQAQGIPTVVVDVQNVYDEFSYGHHSAQAIRDFLKRTTSWKTAPHYVLFLGDASFDPRNYLGLGSYDFIPTKLFATQYLKTATDDWFTDWNDAGLPQLAVGRIPARTADEANAIVAKIVARNVTSGDAWANYVEMIADRPNESNFDRPADQITSMIPATFNVDRISIATTPSANTAIVNAFNRGSLLTNYIGHGSNEIWSNAVFTSATAATLNNGNRLPFVFIMTCFNGAFHDLFTNSLAEALLRNPSGGAVGVFASTSLIPVNPQVSIGLEFNRRIFGSSTSVGDAVMGAKAATTDMDTRRTYILFGDPTLKLK